MREIVRFIPMSLRAEVCVCVFKGACVYTGFAIHSPAGIKPPAPMVTTER